jgi:hypothetical protein
MTIYLSLLICLVGLVVYLIANTPPSANPISAKVMEVGRLMFWVGLLVFLLRFGPEVISALPK